MGTESLRLMCGTREISLPLLWHVWCTRPNPNDHDREHDTNHNRNDNHKYPQQARPTRGTTSATNSVQVPALPLVEQPQQFLAMHTS